MKDLVPSVRRVTEDARRRSTVTVRLAGLLDYRCTGGESDGKSARAARIGGRGPNLFTVSNLT